MGTWQNHGGQNHKNRNLNCGFRGFHGWEMDSDNSAFIRVILTTIVSNHAIPTRFSLCELCKLLHRSKFGKNGICPQITQIDADEELFFSVSMVRPLRKALMLPDGWTTSRKLKAIEDGPRPHAGNAQGPGVCLPCPFAFGAFRCGNKSFRPATMGLKWIAIRLNLGLAGSWANLLRHAERKR